MTADSRDPRGRFLRRLFLGIHVSIATLFSLLLIGGIWSGLAEIRPPRKQPRLTVAACAADLVRLHAEFQQRLAGFATAKSSAEEGRAFEGWAVPYRARVAATRQRCSPPGDASAAKAREIDLAFSALLRSVDLSEVQATHWARHLGPALDEAASAIDLVTR